VNNSNQFVTYKEIIRQQKGWDHALRALTKESNVYRKVLEKYQRHIWVFVGCGTSYYIAQIASALFSELTEIRSKAVPASEVLIFPEIVFDGDAEYLMVPISRSGTTTETVMATQKAREQLKIPTLAVSCNPDSAMAIESEFLLHFPFEQEESVVMTSSFTTLLMSILHLALVSSENNELSEQLPLVANMSARIMKNSESLLEEISKLSQLSDLVFLGQGPFLGLANEAALKMQEMSLSSSQSYHTLEYRHGPKSTISNHSLITLLASQAGNEYEVQLIDELKELGAKILVISGNNWNSLSEKIQYNINVGNKFGDIMNLFLYAPILQLMAYYKAIAKGINPDEPRNLTAVVKFTIEG